MVGGDDGKYRSYRGNGRNNQRNRCPCTRRLPKFMNKYGDKVGPTIEWYRKAGRSWDQIIETASKPGGGDLGY
jgi:hypothetical protein